MQLIEFLQQNRNLPAELIQKIDTLFERVMFEPDEFLLKEGEVSDKIYFVESGILREFSYIDSDSDSDPDSVITHWILTNNEWIYQVESFEIGIKSKSNIRAVTKTKARYIRKEAFEELAISGMEVLLQILKIYRNYLLQLEYRNRLHQLRKVEDRLEMFEKLQPNLANKVPQFMVASFLNTTPSHLSKVRSKRRLKK
jgi:CRP-like cAMP-binding protein